MNKPNSLKERIIKNFKENKVLFFVLIGIWVITIVSTLLFYGNTLGKQSIGNEGSQNVAELNNKTTIVQEINVEDIDTSKTMAIKFATYARNNSGEIYVNVVGNTTKKEYVNDIVPVSKIVDNDFYVFDLCSELNFDSEKSITIKLTSNSEKGNSIGVYYSNDKAFSESLLKINGINKEGDLSTRFLVNNYELNLFYRIIIVWMIVTFSIVIITLLLIKPKLEIIFTMMAIVFGLTFWIVMTPMSAPDETTHYEYSFQLSNIIMGEKDYRVFDKEYQNYGSFAGHYNISAAYTRLVKKINRPLSLDNERAEMISDIEGHYKVPFIPQAMGITISRLLNLNMLKTFYMGRLFNLIFYVICVYIAIKKAPIHKILFGIIGTLPIMIQQAASFSYDTYINGLCLVLISCTLKWMYQEEKITLKEFIFVFIVNLLLAPVKVVYGLFSFLFWFVPTSKFGSKRNKIIGTLIVTAPAMYELSVLMFPLIFRAIRKFIEKATISIKNYHLIFADGGDNTYAYAPSYTEDEMYHFSDLTDNPLGAIEIFIRTIRFNLKTWFYGAFGRVLAGNTLVLPIYYVYSILIVAIISAFRQETHTESILFKIVSIGMCVVAGLMMLGGMLISWTPINQDIIDAYGGPIIQGIQGRYFSPLLPYCFVAFNNKKIKISQKYDTYLIFAYLIIVFEIIVYVLSYTFVN